MHSLLIRQLRKLGQDPSSLGAMRVDEVRALIDAVDTAYARYDDDRLMLERSLDLSSSELMQANADLTALLESLPDLFLRIDDAGTVTYVRSARRDDPFLSRGPLLGKRFHETVPSDARDALSTVIAEAARSRLPQFADLEIVVDGQTLNYEARVLPGIDAQYTVILRDTSERARAEQARRALELQLQQSSKMEAIGTLAGGIAHDFNNLLTAIAGFTSLIREQVPHHPALAEHLQEIRAATERGTQLTNQLLAFGRRRTRHSRVIDANELVTNVGRLLERLVGESIRLRVVVSAIPLFVRVDVHQMEQVLVNLVVNARDAMPEGGTITLTVDRQAHRTASSPADASVTFSVVDTGTGIPADVLPRVFEPFFTTKSAGKGTGLGLAMVYSLVQQHEGRVDIESTVGRGTTVRVRVPEVREPQRAASVVATESTAKSAGVVLLLEHEAVMRRMATRFLEGLSYTPLVATTPRDALGAAGNMEQPIDLALINVAVPMLQVRDFHAELQRLRPALRVVYLVDDSAAAVPDGATGLGKPYTLQQLAAALRIPQGRAERA